MEDCIRVLVCGDQALVRAGLRRLLEEEPGLEVIGEAVSAEEAVDELRACRPEVLLLDVVMAGRNGLDSLLEIAEAAPETQVLVLSQYDDPAYVRRAFSTGATGYLLMEAADTELVHAIREVASGHPYLHPQLGARLAAAEADPLSDREHEVLHLLALGYTNQEIAKLLFMSVRTAETHRGRIMQQLGLHTRAEIVRYALGAGELDSERPVKTVCGVSNTAQQSHSVPTSIKTAASAGASQERRGLRGGTPHLVAVHRLADTRLSGERLA
jgi:two-component system response regulator NreC